MDLDTYRQILFLDPMREFCDEYNKDWSEEKGGRYLTRGDMSPLTFVEYYMDNKPPYTEEDVALRYGEYIASANKIKALFESGEFAKHWTQMLRLMNGVITIETRRWKFDRNHQHGWAWVEGEQAHTPETCMQIHGTVGETLFDTVLQCVVDANVCIDLNIYHCVRKASKSSFPWIFDGRLDRVDLQGLHLNPWCPRIISHDFYNPLTTTTLDDDQRLSTVTEALLVATAPKLRRLELDVFQMSTSHHHSYCTHWPPCNTNLAGFPPVSDTMQLVRSFSSGFRGFIREARNLQYLRIDLPLTKVAFKGCSAWRRFWRSIRYHPSRMTLDIRFRSKGQPELILKHNTGSDSESVPGSINHSLEMYLSNRGNWDESCDRHFHTVHYSPSWSFYTRNYEGSEKLSDTDDEERNYWEGTSDTMVWLSG